MTFAIDSFALFHRNPGTPRSSPPFSLKCFVGLHRFESGTRIGLRPPKFDLEFEGIDAKGF